MIYTNKEINLSQLDKELGGFGLIADFTNPEAKIIGVAENSPITKKELEAAISAHIAIDEAAVKSLAKAELLAKLGITEDEAKLLLS